MKCENKKVSIYETEYMIRSPMFIFPPNHQDILLNSVEVYTYDYVMWQKANFKYTIEYNNETKRWILRILGVGDFCNFRFFVKYKFISDEEFYIANHVRPSKYILEGNQVS